MHRIPRADRLRYGRHQLSECAPPTHPHRGRTRTTSTPTADSGLPRAIGLAQDAPRNILDPASGHAICTGLVLYLLLFLPACVPSILIPEAGGRASRDDTLVPTADTRTATAIGVDTIVENLEKPIPGINQPRIPAGDNPLPKQKTSITPLPGPTAAEISGLLPTVTPTPGKLAGARSMTSTIRSAKVGDHPQEQERDATTVILQPDTQATPSGRVNAAVVNIRSGPGTVYTLVARVNEDDTLTLLGRNETSSWLRICCPATAATESWISAQFLDVATPADGIVAALPIAPSPPTPIPQAQPAIDAGGQSAAALAAAPASGLPGPGGFGAPGGTNPLTGTPLAGGLGALRPLVVCINNDYAARPQFGTSQADVVYEYLMEGFGITRFSAVYYGTQASQIGPVRSARLINYYMGALYEAGLVCSGASDPVRYQLKHQAPFPYMDIDLDDPSNTQFSVSIGTDYRTRLRTSSDGMRRWLSAWGVEQPASIRGFTFGDTPAGGAPASNIYIPYPSGTGSQVSYQFDGASGRYWRSLGGAPHVDGNTGAQLALENVIVQYVPHQATDIVEDSLGSTSIRLNLFGSGRTLVFRDGIAMEGIWRSNSRGDTPRFYSSDGSEILLKPGRTWISVVPLSYTISYQ